MDEVDAIAADVEEASAAELKEVAGMVILRGEEGLMDIDGFKPAERREIKIGGSELVVEILHQDALAGERGRCEALGFGNG